MPSSREELIATLAPMADMGLVALLQKGNVEPGAFSAAIKRMEKKTIPLEVRAAQRLYELHQLVQTELGRKMKKFRTLDEWDQLRKLTRKGVRLAKYFKVPDIDYFKYFKTVHDTAAHMVACERREKVM